MRVRVVEDDEDSPIVDASVNIGNGPDSIAATAVLTVSTASIVMLPVTLSLP